MSGQRTIEFGVFGRRVRIIVDVSQRVVRETMSMTSVPAPAVQPAKRTRVLGVSKMLEYYAGLEGDEMEATRKRIADDAKIIEQQRALQSMRYRVG